MKVITNHRKFLATATLTTALLVSSSDVLRAAVVNIARLHTRVGGTVHEIALTQCANKAYTALRDSDGNLRLRHWGVTDQSLTPLAETGNDFVAGSARDIAIANLNGCNFAVTALKTADNNLKLVSWFSSPDGMERNGSAEAGEVSEIAITRVKHPTSPSPSQGRVVTAVRTSSGNLKLVVWDVASNGSIQRRGEISAGSASDINIVSLPAAAPSSDDSRVLTAVRTADGNLKLITWGIAANGDIRRIASADAGAVTQIALTKITATRVVTAVRTEEGTLKLISWSAAQLGSIQRQGDDDEPLNQNTAGAVSEIALTRWEPDASTIGEDIAVAVRTGSGDLKIIAWAVGPSGNFTRVGDSGALAGAADLINISWSNTSDRLVTALRDDDDNFRIVTWRGF